jgi:hypothetical protein
VHASNLSFWETEARGSQVQDQPGLRSENLFQKKKKNPNLPHLQIFRMNRSQLKSYFCFLLVLQPEAIFLVSLNFILNFSPISMKVCLLQGVINDIRIYI